jgi:membrane-bound toxin of toxin-antitoxin system
MDSYENPFLVTLRLPIRDSSIITIVLISAIVFCTFLPWYTSLDLNLKIMLTVLCLCYLIYKHRFTVATGRVTELILGSEDNWQVKMANGEVNKATLGDSLFVHPLLTIMLLRYGRHKEYFIFTPDNIEDDLFRRLRVRLRFKVNVEQSSDTMK